MNKQNFNEKNPNFKLMDTKFSFGSAVLLLATVACVIYIIYFIQQTDISSQQVNKL